jgi:hypothetical protein
MVNCYYPKKNAIKQFYHRPNFDNMLCKETALREIKIESSEFQNLLTLSLARKEYYMHFLD